MRTKRRDFCSNVDQNYDSPDPLPAAGTAAPMVNAVFDAFMKARVSRV